MGLQLPIAFIAFGENHSDHSSELRLFAIFFGAIGTPSGNFVQKIVVTVSFDRFDGVIVDTFFYAGCEESLDIFPTDDNLAVTSSYNRIFRIDRSQCRSIATVKRFIPLGVQRRV